MIAPPTIPQTGFSLPDFVQRLLARRKALADAQATGVPQVLDDGNAVQPDGSITTPDHPDHPAHPQNLGALVSAQARQGTYGQRMKADSSITPQALKATLPGATASPVAPFSPPVRGRGF